MVLPNNAAADDAAAPDAPPAVPAPAAAAAAPHLSLPPFPATDAAPWFLRVEALFRLRSITSSSRKADYVIGALPTEVFDQVAEWLSDQDDAIEYKDLKQQIILNFSPTPEERSQRALELIRQPLGDQRPSAALREMKSLCTLIQPDGSKKPLDLIRVLWLLRLPQDIREKITDFATMPEAELAKQADSLWGAKTMSGASPTAAAAIDNEEAEEEEEDAHAMAAQQKRPNRPQPSRPQRPHRPQEKNRQNICYYHRRFGKNARNCEQPCAFSKNL